MTRKEMSEIFSLMMLAWPGAEMFRGGAEKLAPTIQLWTACLNDVDLWTAKRAVTKLCKENKFPPTIAEFHEATEQVQRDIKAEISGAVDQIRLTSLTGESLDDFFNKLSDGSRIKKIITAIGGPDKLVKTVGDTTMWDWDTFRASYNHLLRGGDSSKSEAQRNLGGAKENV